MTHNFNKLWYTERFVIEVIHVGTTLKQDGIAEVSSVKPVKTFPAATDAHGEFIPCASVNTIL